MVHSLVYIQYEGWEEREKDGERTRTLRPVFLLFMDGLYIFTEKKIFQKIYFFIFKVQ